MRQDFIKKPDVRSELLRQLTCAVQFKDLSGGMRLAEQARTEMADRDDPRTGQFRRLEAELYYLSEDYTKALASARIAASLLSPYGETEELAEAFLVAGKALFNLGKYMEAETAFLDAESLFRRNDNFTGKLIATNQLARISFVRAEYKNALKYLLEAVKLADRMGEKRRLAYLWGNIGRVYTMLGNFKKASEALSLNLAISDELSDDQETAKALLSLGYIEVLSEQFEKAAKHLDDAYPILVREKMARELVIHQTFCGDLKLHCGEWSAAEHLLNEAIDSARALAPETSLVVTPIRLLAEVKLAVGDLSGAARLANSALAMAKKIGETLEKGAALRLLGRIAAVETDSGDTEKAEAFFTESLAVFDEINARFERAETLVIMASCGIGTFRSRLASLFRAGDLYRDLGIDSKYAKTQNMINKIESHRTGLESMDVSSSGDELAIITANNQVRQVMTQLKQAAVSSQLPVLLIGETGTGKDLLARYYHAHSGRRGEFVAVNCAAFPDTLLEAELFGYRKGAFTGADADKEGLLHRANGGTFFLDEIGELSLASQAKLLTVLESYRARRLGDNDEVDLDIRFIAATNSDLTTMIDQETFRRDLYYRLSGLTFKIPSLAERPEDIPLLIHHFLKKEGVLDDDGQVDQSLISEFSSRPWPGNVRQLESEIKKLVLFSTMAREDSLGDLAGVLVQNENDAQTTSLFNQVEQFERALILKALRQANWNKSQAARALSIHESTLRAKMKRYQLNEAAIS
jgi:transcriptional regulator with PAS, ATPase and Fis domain